MQIDPALHSSAANYKLLTNLVVPRPIAWVSTLSPDGVVNLAPFSFFNAIGSEPPGLAGPGTAVVATGVRSPFFLSSRTVTSWLSELPT